MPAYPFELLQKAKLLARYAQSAAPNQMDPGSTTPPGYYGSEGAMGSPQDPQSSMSSMSPQTPQAYGYGAYQTGPQNPQASQVPQAPSPNATPSNYDTSYLFNDQQPQPASDTSSSDPTQWDPSQLLDPKYGTFFNKQRSTDALLAVGSGLLRGRSFNDGLANAADNLQKMDSQYLPPTPADIMRARVQMLGSTALAKWKSNNQGVDAAGNQYTEEMRGDGSIRWVGPNGVQYQQPQGYLRIQNSGIGQRKNDDQKNFTSFQKDAQTAISNVSTYDQLWESLKDDTSVGAGAWKGSMRTLALNMGFNPETMGMSDADPSDIQTLQKSMAMVQSNTQKSNSGWMGQSFTDKERELNAAQVPSLAQEPAAILKIGTALEMRDQTKASILEQWDSMSDQEQAASGGWAKFYTKALRSSAENYTKNYYGLLIKNIQKSPLLLNKFGGKIPAEFYKKAGYAQDDQGSPDMTQANPIPQASTSTNVPWKVVQ